MMIEDCRRESGPRAGGESTHSVKALRPSGKRVVRGQMISNYVEYSTRFEMNSQNKHFYYENVNHIECTQITLNI